MVIFYNVCECFQMCVCLVEALWSLLLNESYDSGVAVSTIFRNFQNANGFIHIYESKDSLASNHGKCDMAISVLFNDHGSFQDT
jgi:hypothetical protein